MGPREGNEADTVSLVRHLTEGNGLHEYFMAMGAYSHTSTTCLSCWMACFMSGEHSNLKKYDIEIVQKESSLSHAVVRCVIVFKLKHISRVTCRHKH